MRNSLLSSLVLFLFLSVCNAQLVDESINGLQTGLLGVWWHNESRLAHRWAFRTEIGYEAPLFAQIQTNAEKVYFNNNQYPLFLPVGALETRWYYNSKKRQGNSKNTFHNSGNFASLAFRYYPKILAYSPRGVNNTDGGLFLIPSWGMRRNINYRWNVEFRTGIGFDLIDQDSNNPELSYDENGFKNWVFNLTLRIGYKYGMKD